MLSRSIRAGAFLAVAVAAVLVRAPVLAGACNQATCAASVAPLGRPLSNAQIQDAVRRIDRQTASLAQRVEAISALFLGVPYKLGPLGEGPDGEFDRDPLIRFDAFDCTTFIETVMALALDRDLGAAARTLQKIRYKDGQIGYATRNHFIELDWVPNNVRAGYLHDITAEVAGRKFRQGLQDDLQEEMVPAQISRQSRGRVHQGREAAPGCKVAPFG